MTDWNAFQARPERFESTLELFTPVSDEKNKHRGVGNLFDVKQQAIENLASVGIKVTSVTTIVNKINNEGIGNIVQLGELIFDYV